ncbi:MAG TPA: hypothetical protein VHL58_18370 [Thermoanaerobaculia bacterium]|nr:hypothetical protein [Thermoanaerobaculia bacterium]
MRKDASLSTRSFSRARTRSQEGFVLVSVLVLAFLYFTLISLLLWESAESFRAAQRFRSRVIVQSLAESGAELAAQDLVTSPRSIVKENLPDGLVTAEGQTEGPDAAGVTTFTIHADATSQGVRPMTAHVEVFGHFEGTMMKIDRTLHSQ